MTNNSISNNIFNKIEELLKPFGKMTKTWHDHLSQHLDEYMNCIEELARDADLGFAALNFVQAGVLIENSTKMYSINVDYLWQFMIEVLEVLRMNRKSSTSNKNTEDASENAVDDDSDRVSRRRRRRVVCEDFEEIVPNVIDPDMRHEERNDPIKPLLMRPQIMTTDWKRGKRNYQIFDADGDTLDPAEYSVMCQISSAGKLQLNMLKDMINENRNNQLRSEESVAELIQLLELFVRELSKSVEVSLSETTASDDDNEPLLETPPPSPQSIKRSSSVADNLLPVKRSLSDAYAETDADRGCLFTESERPREMLVDIIDTWETARLDEKIRERPLRKGANLILPSDCRPVKVEWSKRKGKLKRHEQTTEELKHLLWNYIAMGMESTQKDHDFPLYYDFQVSYLRQKKEKEMKISADLALYQYYKDTKDLHFLLAKDCEEDFLGFEDYEPDPGEEDGFRGFESEDEIEEDPAVVENFDAPAPVEDEPTDDPPSEDTHIESLFSTEDSLPETNHDHMVALIAKRVGEWEKFIRPKLKVAHDRGYFDIHGIGTEILTSFPKGSSKSTLKFEQVLRNKPREDVSRYFLAALQLANTYNIEISNSDPGVLAMDCMEMTLLSPVRHHEALGDYEPPSEGMKRKKRMPQARAENSDSESDTYSDDEEEDHPQTSTRKCKRNKR